MLGKVLGSAVGVAGNLLGGALSDSRSAKASRASWQQNYNAQKEFAQNSIQWRVQDAKKAGINPYAVVGGQSVGYTPQDISQTQDFATGIARAGNHIASAMGQLQLANAKEDLKGKQLDNLSKKLEVDDKKAVKSANALALSGIKEKFGGQIPSTITNPVVGNTGGKLFTNALGDQQLVPDVDMEIDSPDSWNQWLQTAHNKEFHSDLVKDSKGKRFLTWTPLSYQASVRTPERDKSTWWKIKSDMANSPAIGFPSVVLKHLIGHIERAIRTSRN